ncbi:unnamed protein product [Rotaria sordida]|uniref:Uncharacterized protein n=1 Tax=Rotaria sordida TaxID=392033 RepID=A0A814RAA4_9BILA|nr:unnamed protein product [Rotaria sordida]
MFGFKTSSKSKRKSNKNPPTPISTSNETKHFHYVPSVSQIAPLPQNKSHGILPVLSLDGRDAPILMQSETSETDLTSNTTTSNNENARQPVGVYKIRLIDLIISSKYDYD